MRESTFECIAVGCTAHQRTHAPKLYYTQTEQQYIKAHTSLQTLSRTSDHYSTSDILVPVHVRYSVGSVCERVRILLNPDAAARLRVRESGYQNRFCSGSASHRTGATKFPTVCVFSALASTPIGERVYNLLNLSKWVSLVAALTFL